MTEKKNINTNFEFEFKDEQVVDNGTVENFLTGVPRGTFESSTIIPIDISGEKYTIEATVSSSLEFADVTLNKLRSVYTESGNSLDAAYDYLKEQVLSNPDNINFLMIDLSGTVSDLYDHDINYRNLGDNAKEMLNNILQCKDGEELKGFVCMGIHEFGMKVLHDCNIPAVVLCGNMVGGGSHATLLYKAPDGKYVYNDYRKSITIDAPSLIDAIKTVHKQSGDLESSGYVSIIDENNSYQKYAFEQEALWANELDKMDYDKASPFDEHIKSDSTNISGRYEMSNLGNQEANITGTFVWGNDTKQRETSISLGYKDSQQTALFDKSNAVGIKLEHNGINKKDNGGEIFFETKLVAENIKGVRNLTKIDSAPVPALTKIELRLYDKNRVDVTETFDLQTSPVTTSLGGRKESEQKSNNFTTFFHGVFGKKTPLNEELNNVAEATLTGSGTFTKNKKPGEISAFGDARLTLEDGIGYSALGKNWSLDSNISAGYVGDLKFTGGAQNGGIQSGIKLNAGSSFVMNPQSQTTVGAEIEGHTVMLKPYQDYGTSASFFAGYKFTPDKSIYGKAIFEKDTQHLSLGGFNEKSYDRTTFGAAVGTHIGNVDGQLTLKKSVNGQNRTYDNTTVALGVKVSF